MILPNRYAHEIRNNDRLSFRDGLEKVRTAINLNILSLTINNLFVQDFLTTVPGLEALFTGTFHNDIVWDTASAFSRKIGLLIEPLSTETGVFLQENWSEDTGIQPTSLHDGVSC